MFCSFVFVSSINKSTEKNDVKLGHCRTVQNSEEQLSLSESNLVYHCHTNLRTFQNVSSCNCKKNKNKNVRRQPTNYKFLYTKECVIYIKYTAIETSSWGVFVVICQGCSDFGFYERNPRLLT